MGFEPRDTCSRFLTAGPDHPPVGPKDVYDESWSIRGAGQVTSVNQHRLGPVEFESHFMYQTEREKTAEVPQRAVSLTEKHR